MRHGDGSAIISQRSHLHPHHANVDRLWWQWQQSPAGTGKNPSLTGTDALLDPWSYTEPMTRDITSLGYEYV